MRVEIESLGLLIVMVIVVIVIIVIAIIVCWSVCLFRPEVLLNFLNTMYYIEVRQAVTQSNQQNFVVRSADEG